MHKFLSAVGIFLTVGSVDGYSQDYKPTNFIAKEIVAGGRHTCVLSTFGEVKCWGNNSWGELGTENSNPHGALPQTMGENLTTIDFGTNLRAKQICSGERFNCAVMTTGAVKCWGQNYNSELGQEKSNNSVGDEAGSMGNQLPFTNLGEGFVAEKVSCGENFACALSTAGKVKCWGRGDTGQLGFNLGSSRYSVGSKAGDMGNALPYLEIPKPVTHLTLGSKHGCAAAADGVYCWGSNFYGQSGIESTQTIIYGTKTTPLQSVKLEAEGVPLVIEQITAGYYHVCAKYHPMKAGIAEPQKIKCWGGNQNGQLGIGSLSKILGTSAGSMGANLPAANLDLKNISQVAAYNLHNCALSGTTLKCWGDNFNGELGYEDRLSRGTDNKDLGPNLRRVDLGLPVLRLSDGALADHACAILINHEIKCWGSGDFGNLGYEDMNIRGSQPGDMGEHLPFVAYH